ncbi:hypothetical protein LguiA_014900 [Lonicera macranthoides]
MNELKREKQKVKWWGTIVATGFKGENGASIGVRSRNCTHSSRSLTPSLHQRPQLPYLQVRSLQRKSVNTISQNQRIEGPKSQGSREAETGYLIAHMGYQIICTDYWIIRTVNGHGGKRSANVALSGEHLGYETWRKEMVRARRERWLGARE